MEAALWTMSGTMGNQICLRTHLHQPPHTVLLDHRAHVQCWESGALPVFSQASVTAVHPANGVYLTLADIKKNIIADRNSKLFPTYGNF
jgi:threonine aldolase